MYEKKKIQAEMQALAEPTETCSICDRDKSTVFCGNCCHCMKDVRVRRPCDTHPRELFLMDIVGCPCCGSRQLLEQGLDEIPAQLLQAPLASNSTSSDDSLTAPPAIQSPQPMEVSRSSIVPLMSLQLNNPIGQTMTRGRGSRVMLPLGAGQSPNVTSYVQSRGRGRGARDTTPACTPMDLCICICGRMCEFLTCRCCGYMETGVKKYQQCPQHPEIKQGIKACPDCDAPEDQLEEHY